MAEKSAVKEEAVMFTEVPVPAVVSVVASSSSSLPQAASITTAVPIARAR